MKKFVVILLSLLVAICGAGSVHAEEAPRGVRVVVIDAGHGGKNFPGAIRGNICEKNINLQIALKLGALINKSMPNIKVVYTRTTDKQFSTDLAKDLQARADIANSADGDLFISIHANAARDTSVQGVETLIMGESTKEQARNEQALYLANKEELIDMSDERTAALVRAYIQNLQFTYGEYSNAMARLVQKQYGKLGRTNRGVRKQLLKVLYSTDMPSVLTEVGFMSNPAELKYITSAKGQNEIASALCSAVKDYVSYVNRTLLIEDTPAAAPETAPAAPQAVQKQTGAPASAKRTYTVQIMASGKSLAPDDARFKEYRGKVREFNTGGRFPYKYCVGDHADRESAQRSVAGIKRSFSGAFVVAVEGGRIAVNK